MFKKKVKIFVRCAIQIQAKNDLQETHEKLQQCHFRSRQKLNSRTQILKTSQQNIQKEATGFRGRSRVVKYKQSHLRITTTNSIWSEPLDAGRNNFRM